MLRHERACDAAQKTTKERRSFGLEEVHPGEPYGRPNSPPEPEEQADSERMSHRAHIGLCPGSRSGLRDEGPQNASTLGADHDPGAPLLHEAQCFQALESNPVQLGNLKLAFSDLLKGPLLGRAKI